jgi:hypothetical protein
MPLKTTLAIVYEAPAFTILFLKMFGILMLIEFYLNL